MKDWNWTLIGKTLLFLNLALSLGFAFWAFGLYTNRINWTDQKRKDLLGADRPGEYTLRTERINQLKTAVARGTDRLVDAGRRVREKEDQLPKLQKWCADQLQILQKGGGPVQALKKDKGKLLVDAAGIPQLGPVLDATKQPIQGLDNLTAQSERHAGLQTQNGQVTQELNTVLDAEKKVTDLVGNGQDKGLRAQLAAEQLAEKRSLDEQEFLRPLLYNRQVEAHLLVKRRTALEARLKELQGTRVAQQP